MVKFGWHAVKAVGIAVGLACLVLVGCGGDEEDGRSVDVSGDTTRVAYVVDVAGLRDGGFNQLGAEGLARAEQELGIETRAVESASEGDYETNVRSLAENGYDLVIVAGFNLIDAVAEVSADFPETDFAIVDIAHDDVPNAGDNLIGLPFEQEPAGYLAGYLAGLMAVEEAGPTAKVGAIGGQRIPPVESWLKGFREGVAEAGPRLKVIEDYSGTFGKPERCERIAERQIAAGVVLIFEAAARCGLTAIEVAGEHEIFAIGTDGDHSELGPHLLTTGLKNTDVAVFETVRSYLDDDFPGGSDRLFTISNDGVGLSDISPAVPARIARKVEAESARLAAWHSSGVD